MAPGGRGGSGQQVFEPVVQLAGMELYALLLSQFWEDSVGTACAAPGVGANGLLHRPRLSSAPTQRKGVESPDLRFAQIDDIALVVGGIDQIEVFEEAQGIGVGEEVRHFLKVM